MSKEARRSALQLDNSETRLFVAWRTRHFSEVAFSVTSLQPIELQHF